MTTPENFEHRDLLGQLINLAGPRLRPTAALELRVRIAVHEEWRRSLQNRRRQRAVGWLAAAAVATFAITLGWRALHESAQPIAAATLAFRQGRVNINDAALVESSTPATIHAQDELRTGADGGARLTLVNAASVRVAANTALHWRGPDEIELLSGAVYVDSGPQHATLKIVTRYGVVTHLGTRYQIVAARGRLSVGVRDGHVTVQGAHGVADVQTGQECAIDQTGRVTRGDLSPYSETWAWADALAPRFDIENRTLDEFLSWAANETGRTLDYADAATASAARATVLHGASAKLAPRQALEAVLPTTDFIAHTSGARILIAKLASPETQPAR